MARGDHVYVRRGRRYSHHGIDCGDGSVIHYVGPRGSVRHIARTPVEEFVGDSDVRVRTYARRLSAHDTMRNAESRLGETEYHLIRNNCEHFAVWCCTGRAASKQVRRWMIGSQGTVASLVAAESGGTGLVLIGTAGAGIYAMVRRPLRRHQSELDELPVGQIASECA